MKRTTADNTGPAGGLRTNARLRGWRWHDDGVLLSEPVRCKREQWYLARAHPAGPAGRRSAQLVTLFLRDGEPLRTQVLELNAAGPDGVAADLLGWIQSPDDATHFQLQLPDARSAAFEQVVFHPVAERDPKCHPLANVPRWSIYHPPFPLERVVLPAALEPLVELLLGREVTIAGKMSRARLDRLSRVACVLDPQWVTALRLTLADLERLASRNWLIVDLQTLTTLVTRSGAVEARVVEHRAEHEIMSARVEYADVPTRGFALQDVLPYCTATDGRNFRIRVLNASRAWKRYADDAGFATLLASETPFERQCGDVLSAARPIGDGELISTDLPWLVAGREGELLAPRLAAHLLDMHLGGTIDDSVQHWNRWDESSVVLRDIGEMTKRYSEVSTLRWASTKPNVAHLGVAVRPVSGTPTRNLVIRTGRIDNAGRHDGLAPEPMMIFMKWLAREVREQTAWAKGHLRGLAVIWQFDSVDGLRYAQQFASAAPLATTPATDLRLIAADAAAPPSSGSASTIRLETAVGALGDGSLAFQAELTRTLRRRIEHTGAGTPG